MCQPGESPWSAYAGRQGLDEWGLPQEVPSSATFGFFVEEGGVVSAQLVTPRARALDDLAAARSVFERHMSAEDVRWLPEYIGFLYRGVKFGFASDVLLVEPDPPHELAAMVQEDAWAELGPLGPTAMALEAKAFSDAGAEPSLEVSVSACGYGVLRPGVAHFRAWKAWHSEAAIREAEQALVEWSTAHDLICEFGLTLDSGHSDTGVS